MGCQRNRVAPDEPDLLFSETLPPLYDKISYRFHARKEVMEMTIKFKKIGKKSTCHFMG